jgi:hypothetical protein
MALKLARLFIGALVVVSIVFGVQYSFINDTPGLGIFYFGCALMGALLVIHAEKLTLKPLGDLDFSGFDTIDTTIFATALALQASGLWMDFIGR